MPQTPIDPNDSRSPEFRPDTQGYPGSDWSPALSFDPAVFQRRLQTSASAVRVQWKRAFPDPAYDPRTATDDDPKDGSEFLRVLQPGYFWVILSGESVLRRYFQAGTWEAGSVTVSFYPLDLPLSEWDIIIPLGQGGAPLGMLDYRTFTHKQTIIRGDTKVKGSGKVTFNGTLVNGTSTAFLSFFVPGDVLYVGKEAALRVVSVTSDTIMNLSAAPSVNFNLINYQKGADRLLYPPVANIQDIRDASGTVYKNGIDFALSTDQETIQWLTPNAPLLGTGYGVIYNYAAQYEITALGMKRSIVKGMPLLEMQVAKLYKPENKHR